MCGMEEHAHLTIRHNGQRRCDPRTGACRSFGGIYVLGSYLLSVSSSHPQIDSKPSATRSHRFDPSSNSDERRQLSSCDGAVDY